MSADAAQPDPTTSSPARERGTRAQRRADLQRLSGLQRRLLAEHVGALRPTLNRINPVLSLGRLALRHPALTALIGTGLLRLLWRRRWMRVASAATLAWRGLALLRRFLRTR